jgi:hypothetical protein
LLLLDQSGKKLCFTEHQLTWKGPSWCRFGKCWLSVLQIKWTTTCNHSICTSVCVASWRNISTVAVGSQFAVFN